MPELLAPVGNMNCLMAAINAGCDAVYLAGINFGARSFAGNFTNDELIEAIKICHLYGVKVYVTVNTLIYDNEVERFLNYIDFLHRNNADAVIMQDIGMIDLVRRTYPNLNIHASTQLHIHNLEGVKLCEELGIKRVVLARETPIELVNKINKNTNIELEIFAHGALCMSYSGQCLMSALIGSRSGNRGTCAQCCRQLYSLEIDNKIVKKNEYLLSTKDLNTLDYIDSLIKSGIHSLKIEGRMKRPEYVYLVVSIYRKAINNFKKYGKTNITDNDIKNLRKMFNREFTKGFLFNEDNSNFSNTFRPNHIGIKIGSVINYKDNKATIKLFDELNINDGIRIIGDNDTGTVVTSIYNNRNRILTANKDDIITINIKDKVNIGDIVVKTTDYNLINEIQEKIKINKKINISGKLIAHLNSPLKLIISDGISIVEKESDYIVESSIKNETTKENIETNLKKIGDTIYSFEKLEIDKDFNIFIPINKINELRRNSINTLNEKRLYKSNYIKNKYDICVHDHIKEQNKNILVSNYDNYIENKNKYNIIYIDNEKDYNLINDNKCILKVPRVLETLKNYNNKLLVGELGSVYKYKNIDTDFSLNVFNSYSVAFLDSLGVDKITLSLELNYNQIKKLIECYHERYKCHPNLEVIVSGHEEVMICKYNLLKEYNVNNGYLIDRFNNKYKLITKDNLMYIYNYKTRKLEENYFDIGINNIRINIE